jgi:hypothetical protein
MDSKLGASRCHKDSCSMAMSILLQNIIPIEQESQYHGDNVAKGVNNINDYTRGRLPR